MSLFNLPIVHEEKELPCHPWEKTVKDLNSNKIKHAHNSINNPPYPKIKEKERVPEKDRVKFTVIGNRVTKEFIYCAKIVQGMHKYRSKIYDPPVVRGVTSVEWPSVLNNLKIEYGGLAYCLSSQVAVLHNHQFLGGEKELRDLIESEYIYHLTIDYHKESTNQFAAFVRNSGRAFAYMHISIDDKHLGTLIFMVRKKHKSLQPYLFDQLYSDIVPITCENFLRLCKNRKGGYSGTPIHRIVKDGWIQGGGFALKSIAMDCENFIVPFDKRGVLAMANDGRHADCSTQFFVLLQPAPWMQTNYVAFGQLVDGDSILKTIEEIPTWYESPMADIIIHKSGILNMDCQDIMINPGAKAYIEGHIDDLVTIGEIFYEALMEQVFLEIEFRRIQRLEEKSGEEEEEEAAKEAGAQIKPKEDIRATQRFMRRKDEIQGQLSKMRRESKRASTAPSKASSVKSNKEFDVDVYEYEPEEYTYSQASAATVSEPVKPTRPFYIPLTDVPYPGEVSSEYDLKKFLRGDYCLESDLAPVDGTGKVIRAEKKMSIDSDIFNFFNDAEDEKGSEQALENLDSDEEEEIRKYLQENADRVSFAGAVIKEVAKGVGMVNLFENHRKSELITDEILRRFRVASVDMRGGQDKRVSISVPVADKEIHTKIKRRQTGFVRPEDLAKIKRISMAVEEKNEEEEEETEMPTQRTDRKISVSIKVPEGESDKHEKIKRRQTGFVRPEDLEMIRLISQGNFDQEDDEDEEVPDTTTRRNLSADVSRLLGKSEDDISEVKLAETEQFPAKNDGEIVKKEEDKISEEEEEEEEERQRQRPSDLGGTRSKCTSTVSINEPVGAKEKHEQIKRRQTGFVSPGELAKIRQFVKDQDLEDESDESDENKPGTDLAGTRSKTTSTVSIKEPTGSKQVHDQIKRRQTGFVKPEELAHIREFIKDSDFTSKDEEESDEEIERIADLIGTRSKTTSTVSINEPVGSKEVHDKIKRRQTGFVKPEELAKIREYVKDQDIDTGYSDDREEKQKKAEVKIDANAEEKYNRIKRRQTSFAKSGALKKIGELAADGEEEEETEEEVVKDLGSTRHEGVSTVSISEPEDAKEYHEKIKRRQTGFVSPEQLTKIREFIKDELDEEEDDDNENTRDAGPTVLISEPEGAKTTHEKIKRRQTGFVSPQQLSKIREIAEDLGEEEDTEKAVVIREPEGAKEVHDKIKRRQTGYFKAHEAAQIRAEAGGEEDEDDVVAEPTQATQASRELRKSRQASFATALRKVREFEKEQVDEEDIVDLGKTRGQQTTASTVSINEPEGAKEVHDKIKRRQTGFVSAEQLTKIREFAKDIDEDDDEDGVKTSQPRGAVNITEPAGAKSTPDKIKRRQTGFVRPEELTKIKEFMKDEEDEKSREGAPTTVLIQEPEGAKTTHDKIKRRQTGFVSPGQLANIKEFMKNEEDEGEENEGAGEGAPTTVFIQEPEGAKTTHDKIKRRQTGFVSPEQLTKIKEFMKDEEDDDEENEVAGHPAAVVISEPEGAKTTHEKIKRRQTGYVKPEEAAKLREIAVDEEDGEGEDRDSVNDKAKDRQGVVEIREPEGSKKTSEKIKRRQTGYVKPEEAAKLREIADDEEDGEGEDRDSVKDKAKDRQGLVEIREPEGSKETSEKIKRRQTGYFKPQDLKIEEESDADDCDKENNPDTTNRKASVAINVPETTDKQSSIKRRQTGFVRPQDVAKLRKIEDDDEDYVDEETDATRKSSDSNAPNSKSKEKEGSERAEHSADVTALFVNLKGFESKKHRKVRILPASGGGSSSQGKKPRVSESQDSDTEVRRSVLTRLYDEVKRDDDVVPTLKDYKPLSEAQQQKNILLTFSPNQLVTADDEPNEKFFRHSLIETSFDQVLDLQHGKKVTRKISSDYVKTIDQIERKPEHSIRSVEYAKARPAMTVAEYQRKNKLYQEERRLTEISGSSEMLDITEMLEITDSMQRRCGLRLPGDSPLYAISPVSSSHES